MATIGELMVRIGVDASSLRDGLDSATQNIRSSMQKAEEGSKLLLAGVIAAGAGIVAFGVKAVTMAGSMEQTQVAFTTMLGSAERATALMKELQQFGAETPFEFPEIQKAAKSLLAFGVGAEEVTETLRRVGDISSGIGAPLGEIAEIYGKARVQGRLFGEDINQLTGRGIPIIQELAKQFGVSESEVKKLVESGKVGFPQLELAFKDMTKEGSQFGGMMDAQSKTLPGMWSNLMDNIGQSTTIVGQELILALDLKDKLAGTIEALGQISALLQAEGLKGALEKLFPVETQQHIAMIAGAISFALVPAIISIAGAIWLVMAPLIPFMVYGAAFGALAFIIYKNWAPIKDFFRGIGESISNTIDSIKTKVGEMVQAGENVAQGLWQGLQNSSAWLKAKVMDWIKQVLPDPILKALNIKSPSKVMADIGLWAAKGLAMGLGSGTGEVVTQAQVLANAVTSIKTQIEELNKQYEVAYYAQGANSEAAKNLKEQIATLALQYDNLTAAIGKTVEKQSLFQSLTSLAGSATSSSAQYIGDVIKYSLETKDMDWSNIGIPLGGQWAPGKNIPSYDVGTPYVPQDGLAYLHKGEAVIPANQNKGGNMNIQINLDGRTLAKVLMPYMPGELARVGVR